MAFAYSRSADIDIITEGTHLGFIFYNDGAGSFIRDSTQIGALDPTSATGACMGGTVATADIDNVSHRGCIRDLLPNAVH